MVVTLRDVSPVEDPIALLERSFIDEFIRTHGHDPSRLGSLPEDQRTRLLKQASTYAAVKLADVECKAHYLHDIHGER